MSITKDAGLFMAAKVGEGVVEGLQEKLAMQGRNAPKL